VHVAVQPRADAAVELANIDGRVEIHLGQEAPLEIPERPLHLPLAGGIPRVARIEREPVLAGERQRHGMPLKPFATRLAELPIRSVRPTPGTPSMSSNERAKPSSV
jgi:hypothetical protein